MPALRSSIVTVLITALGLPPGSECSVPGVLAADDLGGAASSRDTTNADITSHALYPGATATDWLRNRARLQQKHLPLATGSVSRVYRLASDFGADPTGVVDAAPAFDRALAQAWADAAGTNSSNQQGAPDLAGATIELEGGTFGVSRPVSFPTALGGGNMWFRGGTVRALPSFVTASNGTDAVVELKGTASKQFGDVNFEDLTIDGAGFASGGLRIEHGYRVHVSLRFNAFHQCSQQH